MNWPDQRPVTARELQLLLQHVDHDEFLTRFQLTRAQLTKWRAEGVPPGPYSALVRYFAETTQLTLQPVAVGTACVLCDAAAALEFAGCPVCSYCREHPRSAGERLGFSFETGMRGLQGWLGIGSPKSFEFPFAARLTRQRGTWFARPDPEIGHEEFDDAVHIETADYEALFDAFQHPRRRVLAQGIATAVELQINVNTVYALLDQGQVLHMERLQMGLLLLAWSLAYETAPHMVDP